MVSIHVPPTYDVDIMGENLVKAANLAHSLPPAWDGAKISQPLALPGGEMIGLMMPGRGLKLMCDLKELGITRHIPHVYEDTITRHLMDILKSERGAITTYDGIIASRCGGTGNDTNVFKASATTVANAWHSLAGITTGLPANMTYTAIPGGAVHNRANQGAWSLGMTNPGGSNKKYLLTIGWSSTQQLNMFVLSDLLVACSGISATVNTSQTVNSTALTRYTGGAGVMAIMEVTTAIGTTASNLTLTYTNQDGTGSRSTGAQAMTVSSIVGRLLPITLGSAVPLQAGDYGIRSVQTAQLSAAMSAGVMALHIYYPLAYCPGVGANAYTERDSTIQIDGITELVNASGVLGCLTVYVLPNTTTSGIVNCFMRTCEG